MPDVRRAARQTQSRPQIDDLQARMLAIRAKLSAKSGLAIALHYALKRWQALTRYLDDGRLEIDNLIAERAIRGIAIGRRNWLFAGSKAGGERAAAIYSIIETCKLNSVEPFAYITDVMQRITAGCTGARSFCTSALRSVTLCAPKTSPSMTSAEPSACCEP